MHQLLAGMVKKAIGTPNIIHDRSKISDGKFEECCSAISHTKVSKSSFSRLDVLNPIKVRSLFQRMLDEVCALDLHSSIIKMN